MQIRLLAAGLFVALSSAAAAGGHAPVYGYRVVHVYPHQPDAFTEGLVYADGGLYESTGLQGRSQIRRLDLKTGGVRRVRNLDARFFGEGLTAWGPDLIQLTWHAGVAFVYDRTTFARRRVLRYAGEGWGLTGDGRHLVMSDGTATLRLLDPVTLRPTGRVTVHDGDTPVTNLNELEYVRGRIWANVWKSDRIAAIDPASGAVTAWIDLSGLLGGDDRRRYVDVLNGIAYDAAGNRLFVTGKLWPKLFEIKVAGRP